MTNIFDRLSELANKKNINVADLILSGTPPEEALKFLENYQPPLTGVGGLFKGIGRGIYHGVASIPVGLASIAGYAIPSLGEWAREQEEYLAREYGVPEGSDLLGKVGYVLGQVGSLVAPGATLKLLGGVGKLSKLPTLEKAKDLAEPVTRYGIPTFIGATTAEQAYREQPEEEKNLPQALLGGAISGGVLAIPLHRTLSRWAGTTVSPEKVKAIVEGAEKMPSTLGLMGKEALVGAISFPLVTTGMELGHQIGRGRIDLEELARSKAEMGLPEAIVGGLLGGVTGLRVKGAYKKSVMAEMRKDMEKEISPMDESVKEVSPKEYEAKKEEYIGNYLDKMEEFYEEGAVFSRDGKEKITFYKVIDPNGKTTFVYKETGEPYYTRIFEGNGQEFYRFILNKLGYIQDIEIRSPEPTVRDRVAQNLYDLYLKAQEEINRGKVSGEQLELFRRTPVDEAIPTKEPYVFTSPESKRTPYQYGLFEPTREDYLKQYYDTLSREAEKYGWDRRKPLIEFLTEKGFDLSGLPPEVLAEVSKREVQLYDEYGKPIGEQPREVIIERPATFERKIVPSVELIPREKLPKTSQTIISKVDHYIGRINDKGEELLDIGAIKRGNKNAYGIKVRLANGSEIFREYPTITDMIKDIKRQFRSKSEQKPYFDETGQGYLFGKPEKPIVKEKEIEEVPPETKPTTEEQLSLPFGEKPSESRSDTISEIQIGWKGWNKELSEKYHPIEDIPWFVSVLKGDMPFKFYTEEGKVLKISPEGLNKLVTNTFTIKNQTYDKYGNQFLGFGYSKYEGGAKPKLYLFYKTPEGKIVEKLISNDKDLAILDTFEYSSPDKIPTKSTNIPTESTDIGIKSEDVIELENQINSLPTTKLESPYTTISQKALSGVIDEGIIRRVKDFIKQKILEAIYDRFYTFKEEKIKGEGEYYEGVIEKESGSQLDKHFLENVPYGKNIYSTVRNYRRYKEGELKSPPKDVPIETLELLDRFLTIVKENPSKVKQFDLESINKLFSAFIDAKRIETETLRYIFDHFIVEKEGGVSFSKNLLNLVKESAKEFKSSLAEVGNTIRKDETAIRKEINKLDKDLKGINSKVDNLTTIRDTLEGLLNNTISKDTILDIPVTILHSIDKKYESIKTFEDLAKMIHTDVMFIKDLLPNINLRIDKLKREFSLLKEKRNALLDTLKNKEIILASPLETLQSFKNLLFEYLSNPETIKELSKADAYKKIEEGIENIIKLLSDKEALDQFGLKPENLKNIGINIDTEIADLNLYKTQLNDLIKGIKKAEKTNNPSIFDEFMNIASKTPSGVIGNLDRIMKKIDTKIGEVIQSPENNKKVIESQSQVYKVKDYITISEDNTVHLNIDAIYKDIREIEGKLTSKISVIDNSDLRSIEFRFGEGANQVTKTLYDLISSEDISYNPFASKILYSVATALKQAGISLDQGMYDYFRAWYKEVSNPAKGYLGISFIPKDFENLRKAVTSNKLIDVDGYIFISIPSINESMLLTKKYIDTQLVPSLSIVSKLPSISEQSLLVLDAKTFLKKGNIYEAMKNVTEPIPSIIKNYFRNIYGNKAGFESIAGLFYMYDSRKYDVKTLKNLMFELGINDISELYTLKILNDFVNRETVVRELSEKGLLDKRMSELVDKAFNENNKDAIRELYTVLERPLGISPIEDIKVMEQIIKGEKETPLPELDFRSISEETKINPTILEDPINYINFMKETIARVLGEDINILIAKDVSALATLLNNATGNKVLGFALKLKDKNILGILIDGNVPRVEDAITMGHELAHFIWDKIPSTDKNLILSKYKTVENFADAFGRYVYGKYSPPSFAKRAFDAIINLWDRLVNIFRGYGFRSAQDIFDKIEAGEYATKNPNEVPTARFIDAWELSRLINENHRESDWEIAFRTKSQESNELLDRLMTQANKAIDYAKGVTLGVEGEPNIFKYLYNRAKDVLRLPIFHEYLKGIVDRYKMAQGYVSEVIMAKYEDVFNMMKLLKDRNLLEDLKRVVIASDAEGRYFVDLPERLREQNPNLTEADIKAIAKVYNTLKDFTDRVYITIHKQGFLKLASIMKGQASFEAVRGNLTPEQKERIIVETDKLINNLNNDFYRFYDYEIIEGERRPIGGKRRNYEQYIKEYVNNIITILNDNQITTLYNRAIEGKETVGAYVEALNAMKEELRQLENPNNDFAILASIIASNTHRGYDLFREVLDNGFYFPRVRGEGNYEARVYFKVPVRDEEGRIIPNKYRYVEIEYLDTDRNKFDRTQLVQQQQILSRLKETYKNAPVMDTIEAYAKDISVDKALNEFVKKKYGLTDITEDAPEYVIVAGRKAPKEKPMLYRFTPSEVISFIGNLALRAGSEKLSAEIRDKLPQMIGEMYADINYAMARKLHRHWLPKDAQQKAIAGYKEDIQDVLNEYAIRMQGHLSNNIFLTDIMDLSYSPEFREFSLRNPQAKDLIDKQISLYLSPNTNIANAVYKMRALTATMYLGLRLSSALLNYMNFPMLFIPEYNDLKASGFNRYLNKMKSGIDVVLGGVGEGIGDINRIDVLKKYPEAWKDLSNAIKLVEKYASQKFTFENIFGEKVTVPILDRMSMKINIEPIKQELSKAIERNDKAKVEQLQRDLFILEGLNKLVHEQTIESSMYHTLRMEGMHLFGKTLNKLFEGAFFPFRMTERHVRTVSAVMVLNEIYNQVSKGKTFEQVMGGLEDATRIASNIIDQTYFRYDRLNRYWWTNPSKGIGAIMSMPTTLRGFTANFLSAMFTWAERKQWDKIATSMATLFVLGGFGALPMVDDLLNQIEKITGSPIRLKTYKMLKNTFGDEDIAKVITRGLPSFLIDFSSAMKVEFPLLPKSWDFNGFAEMFFGVHKDLMERMFTKAPQAYSMGDYLGAISYLTPLGIGLPIQAYGLTTEGLKTKYGRTVSDIETGQPFKLSTEEAILRGLGFRPIRLAEMQDLRYYGTKIAKKYDEWRTRIYSQLRNAKDFEDMKKVTDEIVEFNKSILEYGGAIAPITPESIKRAQRPRKDEALLISRNLLAR